jgi:integrase
VAWFFGRLRDEKYSPKLISHVRHVVGLVLDLAAVQGYIKHNPIRAERIRTPTVEPRDYRLFRAGEIFTMLDAPQVQAGPLEGLIALMGLSALRPGEAIGLRWADFDGDWLRVRTSGRRQTTKTRAGRRRIKLTGRAVEALSRIDGRRSADDDRIFPSMTVKALDGQFERLQRRLGIAPPGRPYDLRHTAITHAIAYAQVTAGVSIADVARWAGHRRNSTTLDTYCHVLDSSPGLAEVMGQAYRAELTRLGEAVDEVRVNGASEPRGGTEDQIA